ncbi:hypothetical protein [Xanthomonas graminis]|jgi:hypothetical protein|uniref:Uncharacterized protein n=1 Tax=Xanthomonas graminis pv. graminis TaxID=134874 RepID=A0A1M4KZB2_9XANT|nr:hypothetical protein [Xanthomonas translucens]EKU26623.1 hypothetical protein XTG29_00219 [Xanthomonas translucens pv. graminis ART-Xtg29]OAX60122.1 hypothetical protein A6R72_15255 [Xanthomonas translucens pv. graminis]UKE54636.1 hypothetical protein KFS84_01325 [Xanthomonas translucens pv. graminis]WIH09023.1 hypothetical protein KM579_01985 [Xanthomonas translucens pv. graminis]WIH12535.1 hypothetical protein KM563_01230 [Xanthomonas translucens pv. graminis]
MPGINGAVAGLLAAALYGLLWRDGIRSPPDLLVVALGLPASVQRPALWVVAWCALAMLGLALLGRIDEDAGRATDYSVGRSLIYAAFAWSQAQDAHATVFGLAAKHGVGFFDASSELGEVWWQDGQGALTLAHTE